MLSSSNRRTHYHTGLYKVPSYLTGSIGCNPKLKAVYLNHIFVSQVTYRAC